MAEPLPLHGPRGSLSTRVGIALALAAVPAGALACRDEGPRTVVLAGTTSTYDSGLLEHLLAAYQEAHPQHRVRIVAVGSGEALELGRRGDADVLIVHAPEPEREFMADGHGRNRVPLMYNDFLLLGPAADPAEVGGAEALPETLRRIARARAPFLSRGDGSGTHLRERELWREAGVEPGGGWYRETGQGQAETLLVADERNAYVLADRATWKALSPRLRLRVLREGDPALLNLYSIVETTRSAHPEEGAALADWLTSAEGRRAIAAFGRGSEDGGDDDVPLFIPLVVGETLPLLAPPTEPYLVPDTAWTGSGRRTSATPR